MFTKASRIVSFTSICVIEKAQKQNPHSPTRKVMLFYLFPGSAENGTQGLVQARQVFYHWLSPCPFSSFRSYHKCVCRVRCVDALTAQYGPTAQWRSSLPPWPCGPQWNLAFPASFLASILFDSGEINMLSSLIPPNKSPCHHSFSTLL